jgi:SAM-dependent methyltransferase/uncharacterized protein YndB with AHSA1/START domain
MLSRRALFTLGGVPLLRGQRRQPAMFANAEAYERFMGRWSRLVAPQLVDFAEAPEEGRVLDVGSGTGSLAFALAERKPRSRVVGIDPSDEYVAYANRRNRFPDRVRFEAGEAQQLRFADASFDAGLSLLVFNFIPDPRKALREVRRVTVPGGRISAAVWDYGDGMRMLRAFWDGAVSADPGAGKLDEKHMRLCRAGELSALWRQGGLEDVHEQALGITMRFESFADYWDPFLLGQGPAGAYARGLPPEKLQALRSEVRRRVSPSAEDMPFALPARVWAVRGTVPSNRRNAMEVTKPTDQTIVLTMSFTAARKKVFDALTRQDQVPLWFQPSRMSLVTYETHLRAGGAYRYVFQRPSGARMEMRGVYQEVDPPHRWVHTETYDFSPLQLLVTTLLEEAGEKTVLTQTIRYSSQQERDSDFEAVASSATEIYAKLERYLQSSP